jgi:lysophospholipase L1-like esterase
MQEVLSIFARSVDLAAMVADRHDVPVERFWQPIHAQFAQNESLPTFVSPEDLPPGVHDIEDAYVGFDQESIFIDGAHTNELGSRIAAEAMWPYLAPVLDRLAAPR